jgi:uncharacterized protein (TIGR03435 family)
MHLQCFSTLETATANGPGNRLRTLLLTLAVTALVMLTLANTPQVRAQAAQTPSAAASPAPSFEVASVKPNHSGDMRTRIMGRPGNLSATGITTKMLIANAYGVKDFQVSGGPSWIDSERYDIDAKADDARMEELRKLPPQDVMKQMGLMLQSLLAERFQLKVTRTTKELPVYALVVGKNGPKFQEAKPGGNIPDGFKGPDGRPAKYPNMIRLSRGQLNGQGILMTTFVAVLSQQLGRTVLDQTGLKGNYDISLQWTPDPGTPAGMAGPPPGAGPAPDSPPPDTSGPSIFTAVQE